MEDSYTPLSLKDTWKCNDGEWLNDEVIGRFYSQMFMNVTTHDKNKQAHTLV